MNEYNDRPADEPDPGADDRPVAGFGWAGHNPDHHTDGNTGDHAGEQAGEQTDELKDQRTDDETPGEDEPLVGEVWNDDSAADEERDERSETGHDHVGEPFGTEEPMIVTEPAADEATTTGETDETDEDTTEAEPAEEEPVADEPVAETPESVEPVAVAEPADAAESAADDAEPVTEPEAEPVVDGARRTNGDEFAIDYLVDPEAAERFRNRWRDVKGVFVDDPADAVRQASALSGEAVEELTAALGRLRQNLEDHWDEGKDTDTERLRVALRGYGAFIDRLLTR